MSQAFPADYDDKRMFIGRFESGRPFLSLIDCLEHATRR
jgi:hypothetical protein